MSLKSLIERIKISFCCKSKCSLNEISEHIEDIGDVLEELEDVLDDVSDVLEDVKHKESKIKQT